MTDHLDLTRKPDSTVALEAAVAAMDVASRQQTGNIGSVTVPNADGTKTVIGVVAGRSGLAPWVGDTTPPGRPLGLSVTSRNAAIWVEWDGRLEGGIPADFHHVEISATCQGRSIDLGSLREAGHVTAADLPVGETVTVTAVAYDDAHAQDGSPAPNASVPSEPVSVVVASAVDPEELKQLHDNLDQLDKTTLPALKADQTKLGESQAKLGQDLAGAKQDLKGLDDRLSKAKDGLDQAAQAAVRAQRTADLAVARADELVRNGSFDPALGNPDGWPHTGVGEPDAVVLGADDAPVPPPSPYRTYARVVGREHYAAGWRFPRRGGRYALSAWVCSAKGGLDIPVRLGVHFLDASGNHGWWNNIAVSAVSTDGAWVKIEGYFDMPESYTPNEPGSDWQDASLVLRIFQDVTDGGWQKWWITGLSARDVTDIKPALDQAEQAAKAAQTAQASADGKSRITYSATAPANPASGTNPGDTWYRTGEAGTVIGMWTSDGASWTPKALTNDVIASLDAGKITAGALDAARIGAHSISADKLLVGDQTNLWPNQYLDPRGPLLGEATDVVPPAGNGRLLQRRDHFNPDADFELIPGQQYVVECKVRWVKGGLELSGGIWYTQQTAGHAYDSYTRPEVVWHDAPWWRYRYTITVPEGKQRGTAYFQLEQWWGTLDTMVVISNITVYRRYGGELIVDGSIDASKLTAGAVTAGKIAAGAVGADQIQAGSIGADKLRTHSIGADQLVALSIGADQIAANAIDASKLRASSVTAEKLAAKAVTANKIDAGSVSAALVRSGSFTTPDGRTGFDASGFWAKGADGATRFRANSSGVEAVGGFATASSGDRIQVSQTLIEGTDTGGIQGIGDDASHPYWLIWGDHNAGASRLMMGTSPQQPEFQARITSSGNTASVVADQVDVGAAGAHVRLQGVLADSADYVLNQVMSFYPGFRNYRDFMRLYKRAGVYFLDFNVQKVSGLFPANTLTPVAVLAASVRPDRAMDVWAYGSYSTLVRVHIFGAGESYPQGTISVTAAGGQVDYCSTQCFWRQ